MKKAIIISLLILLPCIISSTTHAQIVNVGSGSYTNTFPGTDEAGRNGYPSGTPQLSGNALGKPVPTNDWWSKLIKENFADNLFSYPFTLKTVNSGLVVSYIPRGVIDDLLPITVGLSGLSTSKVTVSDYSDWTVSMNWNDGTHNLTATAGIAMPFLYFTKASSDVVEIKVTSGTVTVSNEMLVINNAKNGASFAVYAPAGSTWTQNSGVYTSSLNGKNYWSLAILPLSGNVSSIANEYKKYAYVFPANTTATYVYDENTSTVRTDFNVAADVKEGTNTQLLLGLLPHQWGHLAANSPQPDKYTYPSIRGTIKTLEGNSFAVEHKFSGILPTLPYVNNYSEGFNPAILNDKIAAIENDQLATWTDSYNEGQVMNRLIQTARIAYETNNTEAFNKMFETVKERLEDWLTASSGEKAFLFYYNATWSALLGYPAGHGQDTNLNDHHFHWGYFIHAAAFVEQFEPGWASRFGDMVNLLVRDAASTNRNDTMFPYLRNFSPYAGHCWANGFATFPQGADQESTSESMQFNSSLIHWGAVTGNKAIRDLGIYLYTTEQTAIEEYWFDVNKRTFPATQQYSLVSRIWGNDLDNGTFWTNDIAASYGIELYPIHGGSLYLAHNFEYLQKLWNEIKQNTGIMNNQANDNLWHDIMWQLAAFVDSEEAIRLYDSYPNRSLKFGVSEAQTYYWLHAMNALGQVEASITADYPIAAVFVKDNIKTYTAHNYTAQDLTVHYSDGYSMTVPARQMKTSADVSVSGTLNSSFNEAGVGGSVQLTVNVQDGTADKVEFMDGSISIGMVDAPPYLIQASGLNIGMHSFYARIYQGEQFTTTNYVRVKVGETLAFEDINWVVPGIIEAGKYDVYEGGIGQSITYFDTSLDNKGDYRKDEYVDVGMSASEGATIGWIDAGEWTSYSIDVAETGVYSINFRYASGNPAGGGPFHLKIDENRVTGDIKVNSTGGWDSWNTQTIANIPLIAGKHKLKVYFSFGEFNLGKMTFVRTGDLAYSYPKANAGENIKVLLPNTSAQLDGTGSIESGNNVLNYLWTQVYGPSIVTFSNATIANPVIQNLKEGIYKFNLQVSNANNLTDQDQVYVVVSSSGNISPTVSLTSPANHAVFTQGNPVQITASASDFDGSIEKIEFYAGESLIATVNHTPYSYNWSPAIGEYILTAKAYDNDGASTVSGAVQLQVVGSMKCTIQDKQASQGSFIDGYIISFETVGNSVVITAELLDNKPGVVAYLWKENPFSEMDMSRLGDKKFTATLNGMTNGQTIRYACKFAFAGGMAVTKYIEYTVGDNCDITVLEEALASDVIIYPSMVKEKIFIETAGYVRITIYDMYGKLVYSHNASSSFEVDLSTWNSGIYLIRTEQNNQIFKYKIIKQ